MNKLGYNGDMLDVVPQEVDVAEIPLDEEAQVEHIVKNKLINKPGGLFWAGLIVANCQVVMESSKQVVVQEAFEQIEAAAAKKVTGNKLKEDKGVIAYQAWVDSERLKTTERYLKMCLKPATVSSRCCKGELKMKDFGMVGVCLKWLEEIGRGMIWDEHMKYYRSKSCKGLGRYGRHRTSII